MRHSVIGAAFLATALLVPTAASPHASLVKSLPGRRAVLATSPTRVQLWFNERLEPAFSRLSVWDAGGKQVDARDVQVDTQDPKLLSVGVPALQPGRYTVRFRVLSVDGHVVESEFPFTVRESR
jgi:methionine-rich copper-binding protein CopC